MSSTSRYYPEQLLNTASKYQAIGQNMTLQVGDVRFQLNTTDELILAAKVVAAYHNQYVSSIYPDAEYFKDFELGEV